MRPDREGQIIINQVLAVILAAEEIKALEVSNQAIPDIFRVNRVADLVTGTVEAVNVLLIAVTLILLNLLKKRCRL